jgi:hypothetical protein
VQGVGAAVARDRLDSVEQRDRNSASSILTTDEHEGELPHSVSKLASQHRDASQVLG